MIDVLHVRVHAHHAMTVEPLGHALAAWSSTLLVSFTQSRCGKIKEKEIFDDRKVLVLRRTVVVRQLCRQLCCSVI